MRLSQRSFPHPVVGNRDDVPGAAFQGAVEMSSDQQQVYVDVAINCSSSTVNSVVASGAATFVLHVECSNTLFRRAYQFSETSHRLAVPADSLNDSVEVNLFVRALKDLNGYRVEKAHPEYGDASFQIKRGDILAVGEGHVFHIESSFDAMSRIGSIMIIKESTENGDLPMKADFMGDKIVIILAKQDFADYKLLKANEGVAGPLTTTLVLPVLVEALHILKTDSEGEEDGRRWVRILMHRIEKLGLENETDAIILAQELLELPVKRALASSRMLAEAAS